MRRILILLLMIISSCKGREREHPLPITTKKCSDSMRAEYHSYFDSVEKCIEEEADAKKKTAKKNN